jgi:hypothetical protein
VKSKKKEAHQRKPPVNLQKEATAHLKVDQRDPRKNPALHRRVLQFLNQAVAPEDLMFFKPMMAHTEGGLVHLGNPLHEDNPGAMMRERTPMMALDVAKKVIEEREAQFRDIDISRFHHLFGSSPPHGGHPHAFAPKGYYMLFAVRNDGVPSEGKFIFLH